MNPFRKEDWIQFGKRRWWQIFLVQAILLLGAGAFAARTLFPPKTANTTSTESSGSSAASHQHGASDAGADESQPQWWTCAMHPQIRQQKPGNCPICQMELVPIKPSSGGMRRLTIKPSVKELMKVQTMPVERKYVTADVRMVGKVEFDETRLAHITAWVSGRLDRLYVDYTGVQVKEGDHMVYIYSEELYSIQEELISTIRFNRENPSRRSGGLDLAKAAREKLRLLGLTEAQVKEIEQRDKPEDHVTIYAPASGVVIDKLKQQGDRVRTGDRIYTVADLNQVWVKLDAYESDLAWLRYGQDVTFSTEAYPGEKFTGQIAFIDPFLSSETRTVKVRVNVPNHDGRLKPEMFVRAVVSSNVAAGGRVLDAKLAGKWISPMHPEIIKDQPGNCDICGMPLVRAETLGYVAAEDDPATKPLVIPATAALVTGTRAIVYVEVDGAKEPTYEGREILLGARAGDYYIVRNGVFEGEMVVTNGNFKIDSALQIQAKPTMMTPEGGGGGGHDHGGGSKKPSAKDSAAAPMGMDLPNGFTGQLHKLVELSQRVSLQAKTNDIEKTRKSFADFLQSLNHVNADGLADHPKMLWKEFLMLLGNDAIEGSDAIDLQLASKVEASLSNNIRRMREQFMLTHGAHNDSAMSEMANLTIPDAFQAQLFGLFNAYVQLQTALAADDAKGADAAIGTVQTSFASLDDQLLDKDSMTVWTKEKQQLEKILKRLDDAKDIASTRSEFALLSEELLVVVQKFGVTSAGDIYELHCPMAFDGRGATWLQDNDQTKNPYYGASMLTCADKVQKLDSAQSADAKQGEHQHE
ncbi:MAG: Cu(I)/Ag(I) efflux system membrane fusion protein [Mariniblastus sp.]|jgi:Cu(I)/Ag(I) efflux system membrane fusion protein